MTRRYTAATPSELGQNRVQFHRYEISETSMSPTLEPGDYVVVVGSSRLPRRGDVVVIGDAGPAGRDLVKRVTAVEGDDVPRHPGSEGPAPNGRLAAGEVYVIGDNRSVPSRDSRVFGPVDAGDVVGRVLFRYWPLRRIGRIK